MRTWTGAAALLFAFAACGGGGGGFAGINQGPTFTGLVIASKKTSGETFRFGRADTIFHMAYGDAGLVTMNAFDLSDIRIVRITDTVVADDAAACGGLLFVLTFREAPTPSKVIVFDIGSDPQVPNRLSEVSVVLGDSARIVCAGSRAYVGGATSGLWVVDATQPRAPVLRDTAGDPGAQAIGVYDLLVSGTALRAVVDIGGLPPQDDAALACAAAAPPVADCSADPPVNCFGKFGIRSLTLGSTSLACAGGWTDVRIPDSSSLEFPPADGKNTSPVSHPIALAEDTGYIYIASTNGRRLTIYDKNAAAIVFSGNLPGLPSGVISGMDVSGNVLALVDGNVRIVDVTDRTRPFLSSTVFTPGTAFSIDLSAGMTDEYFAYVADGDNGLAVVRIARNFFQPVAAFQAATDIPGASGAAVVPTFASTSPLFGVPATRSTLNTGTAAEGVLAPGRLLVASTRNVLDPPAAPGPGQPAVDAPVADGTQAGSVLSLKGTGEHALPRFGEPSLPGPYGDSTARARIYSQNSACVFADDGLVPPVVVNDPLCLLVTAGEPGDGHFLAFAGSDPTTLPVGFNTLVDALGNITDPPLFAGWPNLPLFPAGLPAVNLVDLGTPIVNPEDQTGPFVTGLTTVPRGFAAVADPSAIAVTSDGLVAVASSGVGAVPNAPSGGAPPTTPPFAVTGSAGRLAVLDERGAPFVYRRFDKPRPFDPVAYDAAVTAYGTSGIPQPVVDASPFPMFPPVQLRDDAGNLLDVPGMPGTPQTPDRPPTGVFYADEQLRNPYLLPTDVLPVTFSRTSTNPTGVPCDSVDPIPALIQPGADPAGDERSSLGFCHGAFGMAYAGSAVDRAQLNETATPDFDYYTRNPSYFVATGDGGIVLADLDSGISQVSPPGTLVPLQVRLSRLVSQLGAEYDVIDSGTMLPVIDPVTTLPVKSCNPLLGTVDNRSTDFLDSSGTALECDPFLRMGMVYVPQTQTLYVANPLGRSVMAIFLGTAEPNTPRGLRYQTGRLPYAVGGLFDTPVAIAPARPLAASTTQATPSSDLYVADRGTGTIVRITQSGQFVSVVEPRVRGFPLGRGRLAGLTISPDGAFLYVTVSEDCDPVDPALNEGCVLRVPTF